jgi:hypothetical protein
LLGMTTTVTGLLCWRDFHPLEWQLASLHWSRRLAVDKMVRYLVPFAAVGFAMTAVSGFLMFTADAVALAANPAFLLKLGIMALAGLNAAAFHFGPFRSIGTWNEGRPPPAAAVATGACSLGLWSAVILCGRLIAYV